jgi:hypothetical protein
MEQDVKDRVKRLTRLGYRSFQIKLIIREAIGIDHVTTSDTAQHVKVFAALEKYEKLGSRYIETYSK